jgi:hypothetical protein
MPWARFDDHMPTHRKVRPLTDAAFRLWVSAVCYSNAYGTDSFILASEINLVSDVKRPLRVVPQLVANQLWEEVERGWLIHDFLEYNPSSVEVDIRRSQKSERQRRWREKQGTNNVDASPDASRDASKDAYPSRPVPSPTKDDSLRSSSTARKRASATARGTRISDDFEITDEMRKWGREHVPGIADPVGETDAFIDYWRAQPGQRGVKLDWEATWRNWMRRAVERGPAAANGHRSAAGATKPATLDLRMQQTDAAVASLQARLANTPAAIMPGPQQAIDYGELFPEIGR